MIESSNLIARQPICNKQLKVVAFELLYRMQSGGGNHAVVGDADAATIDVLLSAFNDLSIDDVVGNKKAFVNFTSNILLTQLPPISPKQLVIELLEDQEITPALLKALGRLRKQGYKIALDDFCLTKETISLIDYTDIIKLDVLDQAPESWAAYIPKLKDRGITLLAEKVESYAVYEQCCELGFELFQGYFFAKPKVITGKRISNNEMTILSLLTKLNAKDINISEVTKLISHDANLSYNLLRTINSGLFNFSSKVNSIKHAITMLGLTHLKSWISFIALSSMDNKPQALTELAMVRAKMCEELGKSMTSSASADDYFTIGMFSLIDAFFDIPMEELVKKLSLSDTMKNALLKREGSMGAALDCVINYQNGTWDNVEKTPLIDTGALSHESITNAYLNSVKWAEENSNIR
ncbi:MAG: EAL and modified HD-GYP domain-containing signal transduction protein [Cellvibrionaceae bacterium]|jgi:EAL and modified HD-GYP domain-containing signal transduction protein